MIFLFVGCVALKIEWLNVAVSENDWRVQWHLTAGRKKKSNAQIGYFLFLWPVYEGKSERLNRLGWPCLFRSLQMMTRAHFHHFGHIFQFIISSLCISFSISLSVHLKGKMCFSKISFGSWHIDNFLRLLARISMVASSFALYRSIDIYRYWKYSNRGKKIVKLNYLLLFKKLINNRTGHKEGQQWPSRPKVCTVYLKKLIRWTSWKTISK